MTQRIKPKDLVLSMDCLEETEEPGRVYCQDCDKTIDGSAVQKITDHLNSYSHTHGHKGSIKEILSLHPGKFEVVDDHLLCLDCYRKLSLTQPKISRHFRSKFHKQGVKRQKYCITARKGKSSNDFNEDLLTAFAAANIPLHKVDHPAIRKFFASYTPYHLDTVSNMRKTHMPRAASKCDQKVDEYLEGKNLAISTDLTTDANVESIISFVVSTLETKVDEETQEEVGVPGKHFLYHLGELNSTTGEDIEDVFNFIARKINCK